MYDRMYVTVNKIALYFTNFPHDVGVVQERKPVGTSKSDESGFFPSSKAMGNLSWSGVYPGSISIVG
jgi:hypothetical protein